MPLVLIDRAQETATANTTVSFTLTGAQTGYQSLAGVGDTNTTYYGATDGTNWEVGIGTYSTTGPTLTRTTILSSSNANAAVSTFTSPLTVWVDYTASKAVTTDTLAYPPAIGGTTPAAGTFTTITGQTTRLNGTGQNLILNSENLSGSGWFSTNTTVSIVSTPFASNASQLVQSGTGFTNQNPPISFQSVLGKTITVSAWIWSTTDVGKVVALRCAAGSGGSGLNLPVTLTSTPTRYSVTFTYTSSDSSPQIVFDSRSGQGGDGLSKTFFVWGAQMELSSTLGNYVATTSTIVYGTPTLSFSGVSTLGLESNGALFLQPAGTGAIQAQATTSTTAGGNVRGANAVDWQTSRTAATQVAVSSFAVLGGGVNNTVGSSGVAATIVGGANNNSNNAYTFVGGGQQNIASAIHSNVVSGKSNTAGGIFNFIGAGFTNSGTSGTAVTTQSATMNGTTAVTLSGSNASIKIGQYVFGTSIASDTYVAAISGTSLTLSQAASGSSTSTLSFFTPHGVVVGGGNNQATGAYSFIGGGGDAGVTANRNIASGDWSTVAGGAKNTASGGASFIGGGGWNGSGVYNGNTASATSSAVVGGNGNQAVSSYAFVAAGFQNYAAGRSASVLSGEYGTTRNIIGNTIFAASQTPISATLGVQQAALLVLGAQTTDATATALTSSAAAAGTTNQVILPNNSAYTFKGTMIATVTGGGDTSSWEFRGCIKRGANAASTVLVGSPRIDNIGYNAGASAWVFTLTADTTNGGLAVTVTGQAATTIRWVAKLETTEVTF